VATTVKEGVEIPVEVQTGDSLITIEKLAAKVLELEGTLGKLGAAGRETGDALKQGLGQGLGQQVFDTIKKGLEEIPALMREAVHSSAEWADSMVTLSARSGESTTRLQELSVAALLSGQNLNQVTRFANILTPKLVSNGEAFLAIGLSAKKLAQEDPAQVFEEVSKKLATIPNEAERTARSIELFGPRFGAQMQPFLRALEEGERKSHQLGLVVDKDLVEKMNKYSESLKLNDEVHKGLLRTMGSFITGDDDIRAALDATTAKFGEWNKWLQAVGEEFHQLDPKLKVGAAGIIFFGGQVAHYAPTVFSFLVGLKALTSATTIGQAFTTAGGGIVKFGAAILGSSLAMGALAVAVGALLGWKLGEWLDSNVGFMHAFYDWTGKNIAKLGEFLHLLPNADARKKIEQGVKFEDTISPDQKKALDDFKKKQAEVANAPPPAAITEDTKTSLTNAKELLGLHGQINAELAKRIGPIAAANQQQAQAAKMAEATFKLAAFEVGQSQEDARQKAFKIEQLTKVRDLTIETANIQGDTARRAEDLRLTNLKVDQEKTLFGLAQQVARVYESQLDPLGKANATLKDSIATAEHDAQTTITKLENENKLLKLGDERVDQNNALIAQATKELNEKKKLAEETAKIQRLDAIRNQKSRELDDAKKLFDLQQALTRAQDKSLTGLSATVAQRKLEEDALRATTKLEEDKLKLQIADLKAQEAAHPELTATREELERQVAELEKQLAIKLKTVGVWVAEHNDAQQVLDDLSKIGDASLKAGQKAEALSRVFDKIVSVVDGIANGIAGFGAAMEKGGNAAFRAWNVGKAGSQLGESIGSAIPLPMAKEIGKGVGFVVGAVVGLFHKPEFQKAAEDVGKRMGVKISDQLAKTIADTESKLKVSRAAAELLNLDAIITESGKDARTFANQISDLMKGVANGSIPAKEGIAEIGKAFTQVSDAAEAAGTVGDAAMVGLIKQARALKIESPEMKAFVGQQLDNALAGIHKYIGALDVLRKDWTDFLQQRVDQGLLSPEAFDKAKEGITRLGQASGVIFGGMFDALVSEKGIVGAVDALKDDFGKLRDTLTETLGPEQAAKVIGPFSAAFDTLGNEKLRPIFDGIDGLTQAMKGLANAGFLSTEQFTAMQKSTSDLFDQAIAGGADMKTALLSVAPGIQAAISAAEQFGVPLDADTKRLKGLAEQNGITFKTDPQKAMLDVLVSIAEVMGAKIPESVKRMRESVTGETSTMAANAAAANEQIGVSGEANATRVKQAFDDLAIKGTGSFETLQGGAQQLADSMSVKVPEAAQKALDSLKALQDASAQELKVTGGAGAATGGTGGKKTVNATVNVQLGINENPLAAADTAAAMRAQTLKWTAEAIEDRVPGIIAAVEKG
jgi:hypothetical protein